MITNAITCITCKIFLTLKYVQNDHYRSIQAINADCTNNFSYFLLLTKVCEKNYQKLTLTLRKIISALVRVHVTAS